MSSARSIFAGPSVLLNSNNKTRSCFPLYFATSLEGLKRNLRSLPFRLQWWTEVASNPTKLLLSFISVLFCRCRQAFELRSNSVSVCHFRDIEDARSESLSPSSSKFYSLAPSLPVSLSNAHEYRDDSLPIDRLFFCARERGMSWRPGQHSSNVIIQYRLSHCDVLRH